jgi:putative intracellular protease/amidase
MAEQQDEQLDGMTVAILVSDLFEQVELTGPQQALEAAGAKTVLISPQPGPVRGVHHDKPGDTFKVDVPLHKANPEDYDALLLPGGTMNADSLRMVESSSRKPDDLPAFNRELIAALARAPELTANPMPITE